MIAGIPSMRGTPIKGSIPLTKKIARSASLPPLDAFLMNLTFLDDSQKTEIYLPELRTALSGSVPRSKHLSHLERLADVDLLNEILYLEAKTFLTSLNLNYNDKMSMVSSLR